jgi:hypothetical protein
VKGTTGFFLSAKHWQVFVLTWGAYFVGTMVLVGSVPEGPVENPLKVGLFSEVVMLPFVACSMGWLWSMGRFLFSISEPSLKLNIHFFRFAIIFPTLYLLAGLPFFLSRNHVVETVIIPVHLLALFCIFYAFYFVSKSLLMAEKGEVVTRNDYTLTLLLLFFSLIGIWLLQPRINRLYARRAA